MEPNNFSNSNPPVLIKKHSPLKKIIIFIFLIAIVLGALYLKNISDKEKEAKMLMEIRENALERLSSDSGEEPLSKEASESAIDTLTSGAEAEVESLDPEIINARESATSYLLSE